MIANILIKDRQLIERVGLEADRRGLVGVPLTRFAIILLNEALNGVETVAQPAAGAARKQRGDFAPRNTRTYTPPGGVTP